MKVHFHKNFKKSFKKLKSGEKKNFKKRLKVFLEDEFSPLLNNHPLKGKYKGYRSINVTGDFRAVYKRISSQKAIFVEIGSHSELYG